MNTVAEKSEGLKTVLELKVRNHPGVMSHVIGLFARRAYNVEGIICLPMKNTLQSRMWLLVNEDEKLDQIIQQTDKLVDVISVKRHGVDHKVFERLEETFTS
ncbi:MAG: acetolactate synthase small subunit [Gammaproteobacteria bacterium]|nr:acetolactate synthase small subunit [Gammaproteobacteria bacterium]